jgi:hypothetical protein
MNFLKKVFCSRRDIVADAYERTAEKLVPVLARGNVRLQLGRYATRKDIDAIRRKAISHAF